MRKPLLTFLALLTLFGLPALGLPGGGAESAAPTPASGEPEKTREILVPFSDLNVILENQPHRVLLSRQQYDALVKKAKKTPESHAPWFGRARLGRL